MLMVVSFVCDDTDDKNAVSDNLIDPTVYISFNILTDYFQLSLSCI